MQLSAPSFLRLLTTAITLLGVAVIVSCRDPRGAGQPHRHDAAPGGHGRGYRAADGALRAGQVDFQQFLIWGAGVLQGDFGTSITTRQPVLGLVLGRLPATLELSVMALVIAVILGGGLALTGTRRAARTEGAIDVANGMALSVPDFLWGLVLILLFGVLMAGVPHLGPGHARAGAALHHQFLPVRKPDAAALRPVADLRGAHDDACLRAGLPLAAIIGQLLKQSLKETMHLDYVTLARTKGYGENHVILREALPNAVLPTLTLVGVQFTFLIGGTVIIERLFSYEGLGNMAIDAVINRDLPLIQGIVILFAVIFTAVNLIVDLAYAALNPRLRHG
jgi:ABC-type dipeptide/oligopeptide/nickel transport system permease component